MTHAIHRSSESASKRIETDWGSLNWLASREIGNAAWLTLGRVVIRRGQRNPRHAHFNCEEALYLLAGRLRHETGEAHGVLEAGDTLVVAPGVFHHAVNIGDTDADMIVSYSSGTRDFVKEPTTGGQS